MSEITKYSKNIPHLYFIIVASCMFTVVNKTKGIWAFPLLLLTIPFIYQLLKPKHKTKFSTGVALVSLSSYLIIAHSTKIIDAANLIFSSTKTSITGWFFVLLNFIMALWIIRNSIKTNS